MPSILKTLMRMYDKILRTNFWSQPVFISKVYLMFNAHTDIFTDLTFFYFTRHFIPLFSIILLQMMFHHRMSHHYPRIALESAFCKRYILFVACWSLEYLLAITKIYGPYEPNLTIRQEKCWNCDDYSGSVYQAEKTRLWIYHWVSRNSKKCIRMLQWWILSQRAGQGANTVWILQKRDCMSVTGLWF